eukprot:TRINITY_DN3078_c4_g1_i1.p1 TRINITY_DN3078_c4_g1~~TRINITY_DN3078_c4_g1_i1.p1  ORF type:complete len:595 (-),score=77.13 TRINITY_DN3078_c4_g1_i1:3355-5139(-)
MDAPLYDIISDPHDGMIEDTPLRLCGNAGRELLFNLKQGKFANDVDMYRALFKFFGLYIGHNELWDLIDMIVNKKEISPTNKVLHINDIARAYYSRIQQLETAGPFSFLGTALAKKEDRLAECAKMYLKLGDVKQYCEIMISLGLWEKAIAFAPYVSMSYWQTCVEKYAEVLKISSSEDALGYQLLGNDIKGAVENLLDHEDYEDAKLVKILSEVNVFFDAGKNYQKSTPSRTHALNATVENMSSDNKRTVMDISHTEAEQYFADSEAIMGAAAELAIGNTEAAVAKLVRANDLFLAHFVAKLLKVPALDQINFLLGRRSERLGQLEHAGYYYKNSRNPRSAQLFAARNKLDLTKYAPQSAEAYAKLAVEAHGADAVFYYILSGNIPEACKITIERTKKIMEGKRYEYFGQLLEMHSIIQNVSIAQLSHEYKAELLYYGSFLGYFKAMWLGYIHVMHILLLNCKNIEEHTKTKHGINYAPLEKLVNEVLAGIKEKGVNKVEDLVEAMQDLEAKKMVSSMLKAVKEEYNMGMSKQVIILYRIPNVWKGRSLLLFADWIAVACQWPKQASADIDIYKADYKRTFILSGFCKYRYNH